MWKAFAKFGRVIDVYLAKKKLKNGKDFEIHQRKTQRHLKPTYNLLPLDHTAFPSTLPSTNMDNANDDRKDDVEGYDDYLYDDGLELNDIFFEDGGWIREKEQEGEHEMHKISKMDEEHFYGCVPDTELEFGSKSTQTGMESTSDVIKTSHVDLDADNLTCAANSMYIVLGDFNEVRFYYERLGTKFFSRGEKLFNEFIKSTELIDLSLGGKLFTRMNKHGTKRKTQVLKQDCLIDSLKEKVNLIETKAENGTLKDHDIVDREVQTVFIQGIQIIDGPLMVNEFLAWANKKKEKLFILKVNFEKAFDSLDSDLLDNIMGQMV
uniref:Cytochrome P450 n=1 Tax=Tanacetum cinerariifolium TaxID=118510 RepID=A0A6L2LMR5_TANCI|nr:cytochrome P450 [Tanacetum cinerariifolium]